jgi:hypothetical protein
MNMKKIPALTRLFRCPMNGGKAAFINTPLQRGARRPDQSANRFNGLQPRAKPVETVSRPHRSLITPLKRGVNERMAPRLGTVVALAVAASLVSFTQPGIAAEVSLESAAPVVVRTVPVAGATSVDPALTEIKVTYSKAMQDGSWSWSTWGEENYPETTGQPRYLSDGRTSVLPVKLQPAKFYAIWLNSDKFKNFKDPSGQPAVPYLLSFRTSEAGGGGGGHAPADFTKLLNDDQRAVLDWTDRQFKSFFDARTFASWSDEERTTLEKKLIDALSGPRSTEYYQAINTLAALRSTKGLPKLREIAFDRREKDNRDRWMAIRALGMFGDKADVPELIHLVYHGNVNTRWWAQISLVRITGQNFAKDWNAWGKWWNGENGQPPYKPEIIRWWNGQPELDKLAESLDESDQKFLESLKGKSATAPATTSSTDVGARLRTASPTMAAIREAWSAAVEAIQREDMTSALASLRTLAPRIQEFRDTMKGTSLEAGAAETLETLKPLTSALEKRDLEAARTAMEPMMALGRRMEAQVKAATDASPQTGDQYLQQQLKLATADNYWAKFSLWEAFSKGKHGVASNSAEADKWLSELVKGAYLARFEPVNGFTPKTPKEMLEKFNAYCQLRSGRDSLGGASFFRTTKQDDKLIGSFLTASPEEFKTALQKNPSLKLISVEKVTPEMFLTHEAARQESL